MKKSLLHTGESVRHRARAEWGIGKVTSVNSCGTIGVVFEGNRILTIAKGSNFLVKVDRKGNKL